MSLALFDLRCRRPLCCCRQERTEQLNILSHGCPIELLLKNGHRLVHDLDVDKDLLAERRSAPIVSCNRQLVLLLVGVELGSQRDQSSLPSDPKQISLASDELIVDVAVVALVLIHGCDFEHGGVLFGVL